MQPRVTNVLTKQGTDIAALCNNVADEHGFPPRLIVACAVMESNLDEQSERYGAWPDVSAGLFHQAVQWAVGFGLGNGTNTPENIEAVFDVLKHDLPRAAKIAASQLGHWWGQYGDGLEALGRYNYPAVGFQGNPNAANIRRGWEASARYVTEEPPMPHDLAERWIAAMQALTGTPYVFGGKDLARDGGLDCSGLLTSTAQQVGLDLGKPDYTSADSLKLYCDRVDEADARRGDVLLFHSTYGNAGPNYATHCGVYLRPGWMIDTHDGVHETEHYDDYWQAHWLGVYRPRGLAEAPQPEPEPEPDRVAALETQLGEMRRIARAELIPNLEAALAVKRVPAAVREKLAFGALPAARTISRLGAPEGEE